MFLVVLSVSWGLLYVFYQRQQKLLPTVTYEWRTEQIDIKRLKRVKCCARSNTTAESC